MRRTAAGSTSHNPSQGGWRRQDWRATQAIPAEDGAGDDSPGARKGESDSSLSSTVSLTGLKSPMPGHKSLGITFVLAAPSREDLCYLPLPTGSLLRSCEHPDWLRTEIVMVMISSRVAVQIQSETVCCIRVVAQGTYATVSCPPCKDIIHLLLF